MRIISGLSVVTLIAGMVLAQEATKTDDIAGFERRLQEGDAAAVEELIRRADTDPDFIGDGFSKWQKPLLDAQRYDAVEKLSAVAILSRPYAWPAVSDAQRARAEAMIALKRPADALTEAKRYYLVCPLNKTGDALGYVIAAMNLANAPDAPATVNKLMAEQKAPAAASTLSTDLSPAQKPPAGVLASIPDDPKTFADAVGKDIGQNTFDILIGRGNLLLLSNRPTEAKACFRRAAEAFGKGGKPLSMAIEGVSRCIRAEDGNPGRANAFVESLRH